MNKKVIGKFLKSLREEKKMSQNKLAKELESLEKTGIEIPTTMISNWETGKSLPSLDNMKLLCDVYDITIDELLSGERFSDEIFMKKYALANFDGGEQEEVAAELGYILYDRSIYETYLIKSKIKEAAAKIIDGSMSPSEEAEFIFLVHNFYENKKETIAGLLEAIRELKRFDREEERRWELRKILIPGESLKFDFGWYDYRSFDDDDITRESFTELDPWEKDKLLSDVARGALYKYSDSDQFLDSWDSWHDEPFDYGKELSKVVRFYIANGAMVNDVFKRQMKTTNGRVNNLAVYLEYKRKWIDPLTVKVEENGEITVYSVENNEWNQLFVRYFDSIVKPLREIGYDDEKIFEFSGKEWPEVEILEAKAKSVGIDCYDKKGRISEKLRGFWNELNKAFYNHFNEVNCERIDDLEWCKDYESRENKEPYMCESFSWELDKETATLEWSEKNYEEKIQKMSYDEFLRNRNQSLTDNLKSDPMSFYGNPTIL